MRANLDRTSARNLCSTP